MMNPCRTTNSAFEGALGGAVAGPGPARFLAATVLGEAVLFFALLLLTFERAVLFFLVIAGSSSLAVYRL